MVRPGRLNRAAAAIALLILMASALVPLIAGPSSAQTSGSKPLLYDDFTHDTSLNSSLWQINGPVGTVFGPDEVGTSIITLVPSFSSQGMMIDQINGSEEVGTIQSVDSFTPPFTVTAVVEGTISNGHTFGFAITTFNASYGVVVYGNLNPTNCSHLGDCNDPSVCGTPANSNIPAGQCYYGIDAKIGLGNGTWTRAAKLYQTPNVNITYTVQISVDTSGSAQYSVSQAGQSLGQFTSQVGTGPFYVILEQGEGAPVAHPGPNQAYWFSVAMNSGATTFTTTSSVTSSGPGPSPTSSGLSIIDWVVIIVVIGALLFIILLWYSRRRGFTVLVYDSRKVRPIRGANVIATGPEKLSGPTDKDGKASFGKVDEGDYSVSASAEGYRPVPPVIVKVKKKTEYELRMDPLISEMGAGSSGTPPSQGPSGHFATSESTSPFIPSVAPPGPSPTPSSGANYPPRETVATPTTQSPPTVPLPEQEELEEPEGFGGGRIRQIIKTFQEKGAISPETALTADELGLSRLFVRIMKRRKGKTRVFIEINGKYYLNQDALKET